ncbi:MAG TPA: ABC transporter ATP-binding protein [Micromonosporaceae bacterium]|nr:ABC transporter ATP-binding protein [Micromonosporaceae bacterium]
MTAGPVKGGPVAGGPVMPPGLVVDGLSVAYPAGPVLHDIRLAVRPGETFGLVGESGCGKTTLGYLLGGHLEAGGRVLGGRVLVDGVDVLALRPAALRRWRASHVAFVHQEAASSLDPTMRVGRQVAHVLRAQGLPRQAVAARARELLSRVRLPDVDALARRYPHQLSGGQQQRVVIACALATRPRLLVLDEPTTGLDASVQHEVLGLLTGLATELATAVVLVSHDLPLVGQACDRVGVLYAGRLVEVGPVGEVLAAPAHPYTVALLDSAPTLGVPRAARPLATIPGRPPRPGETGAGCRFAPRCPAAVDACRSAEPALAELAPAGAALVPSGGHAVRCLRPGAVGRAAPGARPAPAGRPGPVLLQVRGLTRRYGRTVALDNVDLTIHHGEVVGLVGESGSGKTTLARAVVGLGPPGEGDVLLDGQELPARVTQRSRQLRRRVQMVFQNPDTTLNPEHRVRHILHRAIRTLRGHDDVPALARRAQLDDDLLDCLPARLSGGQKQRVAIARSFAGSPSLVVCDEPVSALDVSVQAGVLETLARQRDRTGTSYLFISHDLAVVGYLADRVAVLYRGVLVEQGPAGQVLAGPHHPYTARLVAATAPTAAAPAFVEPAPVDPAGDGPGCRYASRCPYRIAGRCDRVAPPAVALDDGHLVRCHLDPASLPSAAWLAPGSPAAAARPG